MKIEEKLMSLRKIEDLEFMKVKRRDLGIWDFFWHILEILGTFWQVLEILGAFWHIKKILGTNLNLYKIGTMSGAKCHLAGHINKTVMVD